MAIAVRVKPSDTDSARCREPGDVVDLNATADSGNAGDEAASQGVDGAEFDPLTVIALGVHIGDVLPNDVHAFLVGVQPGVRNIERTEAAHGYTFPSNNMADTEFCSRRPSWP